MSEQTEIVPRRMELGLPRLLRQLGKPVTKHQRFAPLELPDTLRGWTSVSTQRHVRDMAVDGERVWLATWGGVLCFEPANQLCIRHTSEHGLPGNAIRAITLDEQGVVWASGHAGGLVALMPDGESGWQPHADLAAWTVICLHKRPQSGVYVALRQQEGQYALGEIASPDAPLNLLAQKGLAIRDIQALLVDDKETLWTGNAWGIHRHEGADSAGSVPFASFESFEIKLRSFTLPLQVRALCQGEQGGLWVGTNQGLYHFHPEEDEIYQRAEDWPQDEIVSITLDSQNNLWLVTARSVGRLINHNWQPVDNMPPGQLNAICGVQDFDMVWVAGANGLYKLAGKEYKEAIAPAPEDALSNLVHALYVDSSTVWVGAARGLYRFDGESWHAYERELRDVRAILPDPVKPEQLWLGTWRKGLRRLLQTVYIPDQPLRGPIVALCASANNTLWAATVAAIHRRLPDSSVWQPVTPCPETQGLGAIFCLIHQTTQHTNDILWVGTGAGLFYYHPDSNLWQPIDKIKDPVHALAIDPITNTLWIGTSQGLLSEPEWHCHRQVHVRSLLFDPTPALWVGTTTGLEKWPSPGNGFTSGEPLAHFTTANSGLASNRVTALAMRKVKPHQREIWIGTVAGVSSYRYPA